MRPIKMKAWDTKNKKWLGVNLHVSVVDGLLWWQFGYECNILEKDVRDNIVLLEFTGLKDKNGNEIYEGDILKIEHEERDMIITDVKMMDGAFCVKSHWDEYYPMASLARPGDELEIISNIYEKPELLQKGIR